MRKFYTIAFLIYFSGYSFAQSTIAIQDFESTPQSPAWNYSSSGGSVATLNTGTPVNGRIRNGASSYQSSNAAGLLTFDAVDISAYSGVKIIVHISSISGTGSNGADAADHIRLFTSLNGNPFSSNTEANADIAVNGNTNSRWGFNTTGPTTTAGTHILAIASGGTNQGTVQSTLTIEIPDGTNTVALRINSLNNDANEIWCIDDIEITGTPGGGSSITVMSSVSLFSSVTGVPSLSQSYSVSGNGLTGNISITASAGFEISTSSTENFGSSIILNQVNGVVAATNIFIRMNSLTLGNNSGTINHSSPGVNSYDLLLSGNVLATEPTSTGNLSFSDVTVNSMDILFASGNGNGRIVVVSADNPVASAPADGVVYSESNSFGSGAAIGPGQFVVYKGAGNAVSISGLNPGTVYHISVFEYNDGGVVSAINYLQTSVSGSQQTIASAEGFELRKTDSIYTIDFDSTLDGVNNGQFTGAGFSPSPVTGQLNSNSWAMSGWSEGALLFGGTRTTASTDYTRGISNGKVSTGGVYAFVHSTANAALGFQPGGTDWAPGTVSLKIKNSTGMALHTININYKIYVMNDQGRSSSFNLSWSNDNSIYNDAPALNYTSVAVADLTPTWLPVARTASITGLNIAPGGFLYLRWNSADAGGSGTRDEFALDDISITANPVSAIILPVRFSNLEAKRTAKGIQLSWSNYTESDIETYSIERSTDGQHFEKIAALNPAQNDGGEAWYQYLDTVLPEGSTYYRIRAIELDGKEIFSQIARVNIKNEKSFWSVYPNPISGEKLNISLINPKQGKYQAMIFNSAGQLMQTVLLDISNGNRAISLPINGLRPGNYMIHFRGPEEIRMKFLKF